MSRLLPGDIKEAVALAEREVGGKQMLTYGQYRKVAKALVQVEWELRMMKATICPERSQGHVFVGNDPQCSACLEELRSSDGIKDLIARSSIGKALEDIKTRGLDAHLQDLEKEMRPRRRTIRNPAAREVTHYQTGEYTCACGNVWPCPRSRSKK